MQSRQFSHALVVGSCHDVCAMGLPRGHMEAPAGHTDGIVKWGEPLVAPSCCQLQWKWLDRTSIAQEMRGNRVVVCSCRSHGVWFFWASCPNKDGKDLLVYQISRQIIFVSSLLPY